MNALDIATSNPIINAAAVAWFSAQFIKLILTLIITRKLDFERILGSGGMPSSHSALVCAMLVAMGRSVGIASPLFGLASCFAGIVIYDAMGVRRAAGEQAKVLNRMISEFPLFFRQARKGAAQGQAQQQSTEEQSVTPIPKQLKELIGHTPFEVLAGCALGVAVAILMPFTNY